MAPSWNGWAAVCVAGALAALLASCGPYLCQNLDFVLDDGAAPKSTRVTLVCDGTAILQADVDVLALPTSEPCACEAPK
jgi:hypothetical protein